MTLSPDSFEFQLLYIFSICVLIVKLVIILYLGRQIVRRKKQDGFFTVDALFGLFLSFLGLFIARILLIYFDFYLTKFDPEAFYIMPNILIYKIAQLIAFLGILAFFNITETKVLELKTKGYLSYALLIPALYVFFYPINSVEDFEFYSLLNIMVLTSLAPIPFVYFYIGFKTPEFRKSSLLLASGILFYVIGIIIIGEAILSSIRDVFGLQSHLFVYFLNLVFKLIGLTVATYGIIGFLSFDKARKKKQYEKKNYPILKELEAEAKKKFVKLLAMSKPGDISQKREISEEEVSFFREQNVCIVCRGKILHYNFICDCNALFCKKCAHAISDAENACWACNRPIDESKPTTPFEKEFIKERTKEFKKANKGKK